MKSKSFICPTCGKADFKSVAALKSHLKSKHPELPQSPQQPINQSIDLTNMQVPDHVEPGYNQINCPTCKQLAVVYVKDDHTIASSSEVPKIPTSGQWGTSKKIRRAAHPLIIAARYKMRWHDKENRWKRTVAMMGTHGKTAPEMPWHELGVDERWLLNDSHGIVYVSPHVEAGRVDRWWQLHHRWRITRPNTRYATDHWHWLKTVKTIPRIVMQRKFKEVPNSERYPFREICEMFIGGNLGRGAGYVQHYFTNTFSYMFGQVSYEKVKGIKDWERIELYGCELEQLETEYFRQRPGLEFWFGMAAAYGIEIYVPENCFMLYAQDIVRNQIGQQFLVQYPGYMAYSFKSPSMEEAKQQNQPLGTDPIEENVIGSWDDYEYMDHTYALNEEFSKLMKIHSLDDFVSENDELNKWIDSLQADPSAVGSSPQES